MLKAGKRIEGVSAFEQGAGAFDAVGTYHELRKLRPHVSVFPPVLNFTSDFLFPFNLQPLQAEVQTLVFNATVLSSVAAAGELTVLEVKSCHPTIALDAVVEPLAHWTSSLSLYISAGMPLDQDCVANVTLRLRTEFGTDETTVPIFLRVGQEAKREKRILWDLYHSVKYPEGGRIMRDEDVGSYLFDWRGDHPFTNYLPLYRTFIELGYAVDFSPVEFRCVDGSLYSIYLLLDPEVDFSRPEIKKIKYDIERQGVNLLVISDWYDEKKVEKLQQNSSNILARDDTNTTTAGTAVPTLNTLLQSYFMELATNGVFSGMISMGGHTAEYMFGTAITMFPQGGYLLTDYLQSSRTWKSEEVPVLGLYDNTQSGHMKGRVALFGDSSCFDTDLTSQDCLWLIEPLLNFLQYGEVDSTYFPPSSKLPFDYDKHKEMKLTIPRINRPNPESSSCPFLPQDSDQMYFHNKSHIKLQNWVSSGEQSRSVESKWAVYLQRLVFILFGLLALAVWASGRSRRRSEEILPSVDRARRQRKGEECSLVAPRRNKTNLNTLPIDIEL